MTRKSTFNLDFDTWWKSAQRSSDNPRVVTKDCDRYTEKLVRKGYEVDVAHGKLQGLSEKNVTSNKQEIQTALLLIYVAFWCLCVVFPLTFAWLSEIKKPTPGLPFVETFMWLVELSSILFFSVASIFVGIFCFARGLVKLSHFRSLQ